MIDPAKLAALSLDTLQKLQASVKVAIESKQRQEIRQGSEVTFHSSKRGRTIRICITGRGPKNLMGYEIDAQGNHLRNTKWRVDPSFVSLVPPKPFVIKRPIGDSANDRPLSGGATF